jgi:hypothetical protein
VVTLKNASKYDEINITKIELTNSPLKLVGYLQSEPCSLKERTSKNCSAQPVLSYSSLQSEVPLPFADVPPCFFPKLTILAAFVPAN